MNKSISIGFTNLASIKIITERIRKLPGVVELIPVFPGDPGCSVYALEADSSVKTEEFLENLRQDPDVVYVFEKPVGETPTKPTEDCSDKRPYGWDPVRQTFDYDHPGDDD